MQTLIVGWIIVIVSAILIALALTRFLWFQRHLGFLFHWGGPGGFFGLRFPASKEGALLGLTMGLIIGLIAVTQQRQPNLAGVLGYVLVSLLLLAIPVGVRDYRRSRATANPASKKILTEQAGASDGDKPTC